MHSLVIRANKVYINRWGLNWPKLASLAKKKKNMDTSGIFSSVYVFSLLLRGIPFRVYWYLIIF